MNKDKKDARKPYDHCGDCEENYKNGGHCKVADKYQRLPRDKRWKRRAMYRMRC